MVYWFKFLKLTELVAFRIGLFPLARKASPGQMAVSVFSPVNKGKNTFCRKYVYTRLRKRFFEDYKEETSNAHDGPWER